MQIKSYTIYNFAITIDNFIPVGLIDLVETFPFEFRHSALFAGHQYLADLCQLQSPFREAVELPVHPYVVS